MKKLNDVDRITVTNIKTVIHVNKEEQPGHVNVYTVPEGSATYELIYRIRGRVRSTLDGEVAEQGAGMLRYLPKGCAKSYYAVETLEESECIDIFFDTDIPLSKKAFQFDATHLVEVSELFGRINRIWTTKESGYYQESMAVLYRLLAIVMRSSGEYSGSDNCAKIRKGIEYLNENFYLHDLDLEDACKLCNMSYSYFRRLFVECMGTSPGKYVLSKKIARAKDLLESGQFNATEAAKASGFSDVYYFSYVFKKETGIVPSRFGERNRSVNGR